MPAIVSHFVLAEKVRKRLEKKYPCLVTNRKAFSWGASGPDIFFSHRILPFGIKTSFSRLGSIMHNAPANDILNYLVVYARKTHDDILLSYALGFITHYAFDSIAHPYILYCSSQMSRRYSEKTSSLCHHEMEAALDSLYLRRETGMKVSDFRLQNAAPIDRTVNYTIACVLCGTLEGLYKIKTSRTELVRVQKDWHNALALLDDRSHIKRNVIRVVEDAVGIRPILSPIFREDYPRLMPDYANVNHKLWLAEAENKEHSESFFELAEKAEELSFELCSQVLSGKLIRPEQCTASFSGH